MKPIHLLLAPLLLLPAIVAGATTEWYFDKDFNFTYVEITNDSIILDNTTLTVTSTSASSVEVNLTEFTANKLEFDINDTATFHIEDIGGGRFNIVNGVDYLLWQGTTLKNTSPAQNNSILFAVPKGIGYRIDTKAIDLKITPDDISISPPTPVDGDTVNITVTVSNTMAKDTATDLEVSVGTYSLGTVSLFVAGSGSNSSTFQWQAKPGPHTIKAIVDPQNQITETDEANNNASKNISVGESGSEPPGTPSAPPSSGGGGGGGGSSCNTFTFPKITRGKNTTAHFTGDDCKNFPRVSIIPKENLSYTKLTVNLYDKKPWNTLSDPPKEAYLYFYLRFSKPDTYIEKGIIEFSINKTWLKENDIDPYSVSAYRLVDNNWTGIKTTPALDNETNIIFNAVTPGFSYFAITGRLKSGFRVLLSEVGEEEPKEEGENTIEPPLTSGPPPIVPAATSAVETETENDTTAMGGYSRERDEKPLIENPSFIGRIFSIVLNGLPLLAVIAIITGTFYCAARIKEKRRKKENEKEMLKDLDDLVEFREELEKEMQEMVRLKRLK